MPITTSVPSSRRKPGTFQEFDVTSAARGLVPIAYNIALVGNKTAAGTATNLTPYLVGSEGEADTLFGIGSELALMCRAAFDAARRYGTSPAIYAVSIADAAGTAATRTFTVTGPATAAGDLEVKVAGRLIRVGVASGDAQNTIAANLKAAIDAVNAVGDTALPCTAGVATNVVTLTARQTGPNGSDIRIAVVKAPAGVTVATASPIAGATAYVITTALDVLVDRYYHGVAIANHTSTDVANLASYITNMSQPQTKKWPICVMAETASLSTGNTLGTTANNMQICVVNAELFPEMTGELAARAVATLFAEEDPALNFNGAEITPYLPDAAAVPTDAEIETALAAGTTILSVNDQRTAGTIVRFVTTRTSLGGAVFENVLDVTNVKTLFYIAIQVDAAWKRFQANDANRKNTAGAAKRLRSVTLDVLRQAEALDYIQNVELHRDELQVEKDAIVKTRLNCAIPVSVVPNLHQIAGVHTLFIE
jgi:phage tail sheath gpL-like